MDIKSVNLIIGCFLAISNSLASAKFNSPTNPEFSDDVTDYDSPNGIDYYDVKDHPMLKGEWDSYQKIKPGGLLLNSQTRTVTPDPRTTKTLKAPGRSRKNNRCNTYPYPESTTTPITASSTITTTKLPWRRDRGRIIIDGSDPSTDLSKIIKQARQPIGSRKVPPGQPMRDIVGNEIKPETATNRFLVMGTVRNCREVKRETIEHMFKKAVAINSDPMVTGLTAEVYLRPEITYSITHQFMSLPTGGKEFRFQTSHDLYGYIMLRWYSCPVRRTG